MHKAFIDLISIYLPLVVIFGFLLVAALIFLIIWAFHKSNKKYANFVLEHSQAVKQLEEINGHFSFYSLPDLDMYHEYDNEKYYNNISPRDYLTYELVYLQKDVIECLKKAPINKDVYKRYEKEIIDKCKLGVFDCEITLKNKKKLENVEASIFFKKRKYPTIDFVITVKLCLIKINGTFVSSKSDSFNEKEIREIIGLLRQKRGHHYSNRGVWGSICRVERGKVSNKMRFSIYKRDGYRCCMCGSKYNLEIDHIIPISKGGKTTYDNLQTLCHDCNVEKGAKMPF